jgi:hypothetical protein
MKRKINQHKQAPIAMDERHRHKTIEQHPAAYFFTLLMPVVFNYLQTAQMRLFACLGE